ncbi:MAG: TolC family protein [Candidatus Zixiibacteriota bacterium]|nr:MAG: TolC family protein [candidate division Zixibacteria bacterium]
MSSNIYRLTTTINIAKARQLPRALRSAAFLLLIVAVSANSVGATSPLTVEDVRRMALEFNRTYLAAEEDVVKAQSEIAAARAGALPEITVNGSYNRNIKLPSFFLNPEGQETIEFKAGFKNDFAASVSLRQSIWKGGKVFSALKIAKLYKDYSLEVREQVRATVIYNAELLFYQAILQQSDLEVLRRAFEANSYNLEVVEKSYSQGLVSEFEVLRARVEKSNLLPQILAGESELRLAEKRLKSFIGMDLNEEIALIEAEDDTSLKQLRPLPSLTDEALGNRPEMKQADYLAQITKKAIGVARGDYFPELEAVSTYGWSAQSDEFTLSDNTVQTWTAGLNLTFPLFKGGATRGRVKAARADYEQAMLAQKEARDAIRLEVEQAYDQILQAQKSLEIQGVTIAQAEEGLKIANLRYESGVGTQLEVLSAQTALTQARNNLALAKFVYRQARAQLKKATTVELL